MAGQPTALVAVQTVVEGGSVRVSTPGGPIRLLDARPRQSWTVDEVEEALERHRQRSGPLVAFVEAQVESQWERLRAELNRVAGGQASDRVMTLARYAMCANLAVELQATRAKVAVGEEAKTADAAVRDFSGLTAVAAARLTEAFALAEAEGKRANPVEQTFSFIGVGQGGPGVDVGAATGPARSPIQTPGGSRLEPPSSSVPTPPKDSE